MSDKQNGDIRLLTDVSCAARSPFLDNICLGFEDGSIAFTNGVQMAIRKNIPNCTEAINGIAFAGEGAMAISTRSSVVFAEMERGVSKSFATFCGGAHGVVSTHSKCFVASLGLNGQLFAVPNNSRQQELLLSTADREQLYFYKTVALHDSFGNEFLVTANRRAGVGVSIYSPGIRNRVVRTKSYAGLDVVDVACIEDGALSAIAISPIGEVVWFDDVSTGADPVAMKLTGIRGLAYRILATTSHLFVLTSQGLHVYAGLIDFLRKGSNGKDIAPEDFLPVDAFDAILINESKAILLTAGLGTITFDPQMLGEAIRPLILSSVDEVFEYPRRGSGIEFVVRDWETREQSFATMAV
jgi:hypothetical protein